MQEKANFGLPGGGRFGKMPPKGKCDMKKLKMGMVGGGIGAFIGEVHRKAARLDGGADIVAGAFDVDPEKSLEQGRNLGLQWQVHAVRSGSRNLYDYRESCS